MPSLCMGDAEKKRDTGQAIHTAQKHASKQQQSTSSKAEQILGKQQMQLTSRKKQRKHRVCYFLVMHTDELSRLSNTVLQLGRLRILTRSLSTDLKQRTIGTCIAAMADVRHLRTISWAMQCLVESSPRKKPKGYILPQTCLSLKAQNTCNQSGQTFLC